MVVNVTASPYGDSAFFFFSMTAIVLPPSVLTRLEYKLWMRRMKVKTEVMTHHVFETLIVMMLIFSFCT